MLWFSFTAFQTQLRLHLFVIIPCVIYNRSSKMDHPSDIDCKSLRDETGLCCLSCRGLITSY